MNIKISTGIDQIYPDLQRYAHHLSDSPEQAEDLLQQAILRTLNRQQHLAELTDLQRYMFSVLRNLHNDYLRKKQREPQEPLPMYLEDPGISALARLSFQQVVNRINTLPAPYREVLHLLQIGHSYAQIAARLGMPLGTVMSRVSRARRALRLSLGLGPTEGIATLLA